MIFVQPGLYVTIEEMPGDAAPHPRPLAHGFSRETGYLVLGAFSLSESGEAFFILSNDHDQVWFISNRHLRTQQYLPDSRAFRLPPPRRSAHGRNGDGQHAPVIRS